MQTSRLWKVSSRRRELLSGGWLWKCDVLCDRPTSNRRRLSTKFTEIELRSRDVRVRFAPSPTGYLHLGGFRTALFNYLFAKANNGTFILRIEDTDKKRQVEGSIEAITKSLNWCGIVEDEGPSAGGAHGPYIQSQRTHLYRLYADELVQNGHAYRCFCSPERLVKLRQSQQAGGNPTMYDRACLGLSSSDVAKKLEEGVPYTIRLKIPAGKTTIKDIIRGYVQFSHEILDDQVLMKSDGYPTYHLANVVDDSLMKISHVIRGEEWLSSTPKHVILYKALGLPPPQFAHLGLLLNEDRSKLSKRQGDVAVEDYQAKGYLSSSLTNFVALLGWNPSGGDTREVFEMDELISQFALEKVNRSGSVVNIDRLRWVNSQHIRRILTEGSLNPDFVDIVKPFLKHNMSNEEAITLETYEDKYIWQALYLMREKVSTMYEFGPLCKHFFTHPDYETVEAIKMYRRHWDEKTDVVLQDLMCGVEAIPEACFNKVEIHSAIDDVVKKHGIKMKSILKPVRFCLSAMEVGAGIAETIELLGRENTLKRIDGGLAFHSRMMHPSRFATSDNRENNTCGTMT